MSQPGETLSHPVVGFHVDSVHSMEEEADIYPAGGEAMRIKGRLAEQGRQFGDAPATGGGG